MKIRKKLILLLKEKNRNQKAAAAALFKEVSMREEAVGKLEDERRGWTRERKRLELQVVNLQDSIQMTEAGAREREDKLRQEIVVMSEEAVGKLEDERRGWTRERQRLELQVVNLQDSIQKTKVAAREREDKMRQEIVVMRFKLQESDRRQEDCVGQATKPLLRQIETLQSSLREVTSVKERVERSLALMSTKEAASQKQVNQERSRRIQAETKLEELEERMRNIEDKRVREKQEQEAERKRASDEIGELKKNKEYLVASLNTEKTWRKTSLALMDQVKEMEHRQSVTGGGSASPHPKKICVLNLPFSLDNNDLLKLFEKVGKVKCAQVARYPNGESRGFGFVKFEDEEAAKKAFHFDNKFISGFKIQVKPGYFNKKCD